MIHLMVIHCDQDFIDKFEDYTNSFFDAIQRTTNKEVKKF